MPCTHIGLISSNLTQSGLDLDHTLLQMLCTHIRLISSHLTKSGLDYTLLIGLIVSHLTQSDLDHTLPHIPCTHIRLISSHLTQADRFGTLSSPHMSCTHMGLISSHLTKSGLHRTLHHMPCMHIILISSHLTKSGLDSTFPYVPCTHICLISSHLTKSGLDSTLPHVPCTHFTHFQPFAGSLVSALKGSSLRWYSGFPLSIIPISNIIPSKVLLYPIFDRNGTPLIYIVANFLSQVIFIFPLFQLH